MGALNVTTGQSYVSSGISDIDFIDFSGNLFAGGPVTFVNDQFDDVQIKDALTIKAATGIFGGSFADIVILWGTAFDFSAAGWQFENWGPVCTITIEGSEDLNDIKGSSQADIINAYGGTDIIFGGGGGDEIDAGDGNDSVNGGSGDDIMRGGKGDDSLFSDNVEQTAGGPVFFSQADAIDGGDGIDKLQLTRYGETVNLTINIAAGGGGADIGDGTRLTSIERLEFVVGGNGNDRFTGGALDDAMHGQNGDDIINGAGGNDHISTGIGFDKVAGGSGNDTIENLDISFADIINGGGGVDLLFLDRSNSSSAFKVDISAGGGGANIGDGTTLTSIEVLDFKGGNVADRVVGGIRADNLGGAAGADTLLGGDGADALDGGDDNDALRGGAGGDQIVGGAGQDTIVGGLGRDTVTGGGNRDFFVFQILADSAPTAQRDLVTDFLSGTDRVNLKALGVTSFIFDGSFSNAVGELNYRHTATSTILGLDNDGNGTADFEVAFTGKFDFAASDIAF